MTFSLPFRSTIGSPLQASQWLKSSLLIDADEMEALFIALGEYWIVQISGVIPIGQEIIHRKIFLQVYADYINALKNGKNPLDKRTRSYFSTVWTTTLDALYAVKLHGAKCLVKICQPVVQLQAHRFDYSSADRTFRSMQMGYDSLSWGIQFSYPHLCQNENLEVLTVRESSEFPNTSLFKKLQQWIRSHTIPTPFEVEGKRINLPIRLGKQCLSWVHTLPLLHAKGIFVSSYSQ